MSVLFTSIRPLYRAENLKTVFNAYEGDKKYVNRLNLTEELATGRYRLLVTDELPNESPGKCIWIGHGMGAGKLYGLAKEVTPFKHPEMITYAIASSLEMVPVVARFCGISEMQVIPLGMPRTDAYFQPAPAHEGKRHLYVPTFRSSNWMPDLNMLWRLLPEGEKLIVKPHMVTGNNRFRRRNYPNIQYAGSQETSTKYLMTSDTVITDYSSIMFDAMVLRKPVVLFAKDREYYMQSRGMFYPYPEDYSEFYAETEQDLVDQLAIAEWTDRQEDRRAFYAGACDGHSTERMLELIEEVLCES